MKKKTMMLIMCMALIIVSMTGGTIAVYSRTHRINGKVTLKGEEQKPGNGSGNVEIGSGGEITVNPSDYTWDDFVKDCVANDGGTLKHGIYDINGEYYFIHGDVSFENKWDAAGGDFNPDRWPNELIKLDLSVPPYTTEDWIVNGPPGSNTWNPVPQRGQLFHFEGKLYVNVSYNAWGLAQNPVDSAEWKELPMKQ